MRVSDMDGVVLLVDDDVDARCLLADALRRAGYPVEEASDGCEALELLARGRPWLVVTDCAMPRMSGVELLQWMAAEPLYRMIPAIVMSTQPCEAAPDNVLLWLAKPFTARQLLEVVSQVDMSRRTGSFKTATATPSHAPES